MKVPESELLQFSLIEKSNKKKSKVFKMSATLKQTNISTIHKDLKTKRDRKKDKEEDKKETKYSEGIKKKTRILKNTHCICCSRPFIISRGVKCINCGARTCRKKCSRIHQQFTNCWYCLFCYQQRMWLHNNLNFIDIISQHDYETPFINHIAVIETYSGISEEGHGEKIKRGNGRKCDNVSLEYSHSHWSNSSSITNEKNVEVTTYTVEHDIRNDGEGYFNFDNLHRVPFPELGMDIIDPYHESYKISQNEVNDQKHVETISYVQSWKENWLFRKRSLQKYSKPVAMFVPNSNTEYRAMIGDKDADETSDLSEYSTYSDEDETDMIIAIKTIFPMDDERNEMTLRDTQHSRANIEQTDFIPKRSNSQMRSSPVLISDKNIDLTCPNISRETKSSLNSPTLQSIENEKEKDHTCTEQNILKSNGFNLDLKTDTSTTSNKMNGIETISMVNEKTENFDTKIAHEFTLSPTKDQIEEEINLFTPPKPGSIADREHKKWENAAPIKNNPYSKENIQKRLNQKKNTTNFSDLSGFNNNYYIDNLTAAFDGKKQLESDLLKTTSPSSPHLHTNSSAFTETEKHIQDFTESNLKLTVPASKNNREISNSYMTYTTVLEFLPAVAEYALPSSTVDNESSENKRKNKKNEMHAKLNNQETSADNANEMVDSNSNFKTIELQALQQIDMQSLDSSKKCEKKNKTVPIPDLRKHQDVANKETNDTSKYNNTNCSLSAKKIDATRKSSLKQVSSNGDIRSQNKNDKTISLPSVKKLVQAFNKRQTEKSTFTSTSQKNGNEGAERLKSKVNRSNLTPKQLHSLTARSLSKEFREGLR